MFVIFCRYFVVRSGLVPRFKDNTDEERGVWNLSTNPIQFKYRIWYFRFELSWKDIQLIQWTSQILNKALYKDFEIFPIYVLRKIEMSLWYHCSIENSICILLDLLVIIIKGWSNSNRINHAFFHHNQILFWCQEK